MNTRELPHVVRRAMPYCVMIEPGKVEILGREYGVLIKIEGYGIPKRFPTRKMLESWAHGGGGDGGIQRYDKEKRTVNVWFYNDGGRLLTEYLKALRSFGLWLHRSCRQPNGTLPLKEWRGEE